MYMDETSTGILAHDNETKSKFRVVIAWLYTLCINNVYVRETLGVLTHSFLPT